MPPPMLALRAAHAAYVAHAHADNTTWLAVNVHHQTASTGSAALTAATTGIIASPSGDGIVDNNRGVSIGVACGIVATFLLVAAIALGVHLNASRGRYRRGGGHGGHGVADGPLAPAKNTNLWRRFVDGVANFMNARRRTCNVSRRPTYEYIHQHDLQMAGQAKEIDKSSDPTSPPAPAAPSAVRGASLLIVLQVASRAATFVANQLLLRFVTAELLGVATQLEVYYLSVLFFARESLRVAIQRQGGQKEVHSANKASVSQTAVNLAYVSILLGAVVALVLGWSYQASVTSDTPYLLPSLWLYALASAVELWSEPAFVVLQLRLQFGARAQAESVATVLRCATTLGVASFSQDNIGVLPFALGQLAYGVGLLGVYAWHGSALARREGFSLVPRRLSPVSVSVSVYTLQLFDRPTLMLARSMAVQSVVKHLLTQGDTLLVGILSTTQAQGIYALANNYGGLAARLLFQPVEESSRSYFSRLLAGASKDDGKDGKDDGKTDDTTDGDNKDKDNEKEKEKRAARDLQTLLKLYLVLSLVITALGPAASAPFLGLVTGPRWTGSGAAETLAAYMWYIPLLAINGVAEAFVASVATEAQVYAQSVWMGLFSVVFAGAGYVCLHVLDGGARGLVAANIVNMTCRIVWCSVFIGKYFAHTDGFFTDATTRLLPHPMSVLAAVVASQAVQRVVEPAVGAVAQFTQLAKIAVAAVPLVLTIAFFERKFLLQCYSFVRGKET